jgi:hypothetical protein
MVVREVSKVYELIKTHQPLFLLQPATTTTQMAQHLLSEALRALNIAMTKMQKQQEIPAAASPLPVVKPEPQLSSPTTSTSARSSKRKRYCVLYIILSPYHY